MQGMLSFSLIQSFPTESFAQIAQETNPEGCEAENWAESRLECLPEVEDVEEDGDVALYVSQADEGEAQIGKKDVAKVDESQINNVLHGAEIEEIGSEEENENLSERLKILRNPRL